MKTLSLKLPEALAFKLSAASQKRHASKSALVREALEAYLANGHRLKGISCLDLAADLAGCLGGGPKDLSSNQKHLDGFGR